MESSGEIRCEVCHKVQSSQAALKQHMRRIHRRPPKVPVNCNECGKSLRDEHTLRCHMKAVHSNKHLRCSLCPKTFSQPGILNAHIQTHSEEKRFKCGECGQTFKNTSYFKKHQEAHHGSRRHVCGVCGKSYLQSSHLKDHISVHTGEKKFQCDDCEMVFRHSRSFKEHINMHQGIKPFNCNYCPYSTCFKKNLASHKKRHRTSTGNSCLVESEGEPPPPDILSVTQDLEDSPILILVNIPGNPSSLEHSSTSEVSCELQTVEVEENPDSLLSSQSPMSLLLNAADTGKMETKEEFVPLDLSVSTTQLSKNPDNQMLEFTSVNSGRRRSVFLTEELDFEHHGDMRVVDPHQVAGLNT